LQLAPFSEKVKRQRKKGLEKLCNTRSREKMPGGENDWKWGRMCTHHPDTDILCPTDAWQ
jgi:hypothetical protein